MPSALNIFTSRRRKYAYGVCNSARFGAARRRVLFPVSAYERVTRHAPSFELASKRSHNSFAVHLGTLLALNFISVMPVSAEGPLLQLAGYVIEKSWSFKQSIEIEREKGRAGDGGWTRCFAILTLFYRVGIPQEFRVSAPVSRNWNLGAKEGERHLREKPPARACVTHSSEPFR